MPNKDSGELLKFFVSTFLNASLSDNEYVFRILRKNLISLLITSFSIDVSILS